MHNNASIHTANEVTSYLFTFDFTVMEWPPYSSDLNPIEHCWGLLKQNVHVLAPTLLTNNKQRSSRSTASSNPFRSVGQHPTVAF